MAIPPTITTNSSATLLLSEVLDKVHKAKTKDKKIAILRENDTQAMRMVLKSSFDPKIEWMMPEGTKYHSHRMMYQDHRTYTTCI